MMNSQKGQALPLALVALAIGMLVVAPFLSHAGSSLVGSRIYEQAIDEQYSADAGVEYAIWQIQSGESEVPEGEELELPQFALNSKTVNVTIANEGEWIYKITSTATSDDGSSTTIEAYVSITVGLFDDDYTVFAGDFILHHEEEYTGDIYVEGDVNIAEGTTITGIVYAEGDIELARDATITGNVCAEGNITLNEGAVINGTVCAGENVYLHSEAIINGDVHAVGNVDLDARATINGDVYLGGYVDLDHESTITGDYPLAYGGCPLLGISDIIIQRWEIMRQQS
jgi:cytoskeletal protein CcmA (bactofilin family)